MIQSGRSLARSALAAATLCGTLLLGCVTSRPESIRVAPRELDLIAQRAEQLVSGATSDRERAQRIYDFVREEVEYGFTRRFDEAAPDFTLEVARGHCNPQTELLVALMRAAGLEARQRFVTIDPDILDGLLPKRAASLEELNHSFAEVRLDGSWVRIDGYAVDPALLRGARERLARENREAGYGVHVDSCSEWDGLSDCMGQFVDSAWQRELYEPLEPARDFYRSESYTQRMRGLNGLLYRTFGVAWMNRKLRSIRRSAAAGVEAAESQVVAAPGD